MHNLSKPFTSYLKQHFQIQSLTLITKLEGKDTNKYLFGLVDGNNIEAVLMKHDYGNSLCVSTEVGCNMGCTFCESGRLKKVRNLEPFEMVLQILLAEEDLKSRIDSIVI